MYLWTPQGTRAQMGIAEAHRACLELAGSKPLSKSRRVCPRRAFELLTMQYLQSECSTESRISSQFPERLTANRNAKNLEILGSYRFFPSRKGDTDVALGTKVALCGDFILTFFTNEAAFSRSRPMATFSWIS